MFRVGDIISIKEGYTHAGALCFVEDIVTPPEKCIGVKDGRYSLYGFSPHNVNDWYYGDYRGSELLSAGERITKGQLVLYKKNLQGNMQSDIDVVIERMFHDSELLGLENKIKWYHSECYALRDKDNVK